MNNPSFESVNLLGVRVDLVTEAQLVAFILAKVKAGEKVVISYVNMHALNLAYQDVTFRSILNASDLVFCDGFGVSWAAKFFLKKYLPRLTPPDWLPGLAKVCSTNSVSLYFLGGAGPVAERASQKLQVETPRLNIAGFHHGFFDRTPGSHENQVVLEAINNKKPAILLVGFGMPLQEKWISENIAKLDVNVTLAVGAMFDYLGGQVPRAPRWMTDHGLEWLGRLLIEPKRLWKRYLIGNPLFVWRIFLHHGLGIKLR